MTSIRAGQALAAVAAALAVCSVAEASQAQDGARSPSRVAAHDVGRAPGKVAGYWTSGRLRRADPLDVAIGRSGEPRRSSSGTVKQPLAQATVFASLVSDPTATGDRTNGVVFFHDPTDGHDYRCSGTSVDAPSHGNVSTAGHCVFYGQWVTNWIFIPGYHDGQAPFGVWAATGLSAPSGWTSSFECPSEPDNCPNFDFDMGAAVTAPTGGGQGLEDVVGGRYVLVDQPRPQTYHAYGYPADGPFDGQSQWRCDSPYAGDDTPDSRGGPAPMAISCDMTGGASGGGWVVGDCLQGSTSYGYEGQPDTLYGPYFGSAAASLYGVGDPPALQIELKKHPKAKTRRHRARFGFAVVDDSSAHVECRHFGFQCILGGKAAKICSSGQITYRHLSRRKHTFRVKSLNSAGNPEGPAATYKFKVRRRRDRDS